MLFYKSLIDLDPEVPESQRQSVAEQVQRFWTFTMQNSDKMRTPGTPG